MLAPLLETSLAIREPPQFSETAYLLVEIRDTSDHVMLSAHSTRHSRAIKIYDNRALEIIDQDKTANETRRTIYGTDGTITTYATAWSLRSKSYVGEDNYPSEDRLIEKCDGQTNRVNTEWEKYDKILLEAEAVASRQPFSPARRIRRISPPSKTV